MASNEEIYFSDENTFNIISDILIKNGLYESPLEAVEKDNSLMLAILHSAKDFVKGVTSEKNFILSLQNQLKTTPQVAESLAKDIKEKIIPLAEKIEVRAQPQEEKPIIAAPPRMINENIVTPPVSEELQTTREKIIDRKARLPKNIIKPPEIVRKETASPKKSDSYREPIE